MAVVTNDIYTREDAEFLVRNEALPADRVIGVETGGCPHTAIRDDTSMNLAAIAELEKRHPDCQVILVESGGDNLSATFSPELVDSFIYVIDVAEGDKIPRKGGPAIRHSDLLLINKTELAPYVGADLEVMARDAKLMRGEKPFLFADLRSEKGQGRAARLAAARGALRLNGGRRPPGATCDLVCALDARGVQLFAEPVVSRADAHLASRTSTRRRSSSMSSIRRPACSRAMR